MIIDHGKQMYAEQRLAWVMFGQNKDNARVYHIRHKSGDGKISIFQSNSGFDEATFPTLELAHKTRVLYGSKARFVGNETEAQIWVSLNGDNAECSNCKCGCWDGQDLR